MNEIAIYRLTRGTLVKRPLFMAPDPVKVATSVDDGDKYRDQSASSWNKKGRRVLEQNNGNARQKIQVFGKYSVGT
jgi:hypothetical protein